MNVCSGNILFSQDEKDEQGWQLIPIDFEYASYNYRYTRLRVYAFSKAISPSKCGNVA